MFGRLFASNAEKKNAYRLYKALVDQARSPVFYTEWGVEDTIEGRFDMILLHLYLVDARLESEGETYTRLRRFMQEAMISDMDRSFRELGVGDMSVGKEMKKVGAAWLGRRSAYATAFKDAELTSALFQTLVKNVYRGEEKAGAKPLANYCSKAAAGLAEMPMEAPALCAVQFPTDQSLSA